MYYSHKKFTLTAKLNKNGKKTLNVQFFSHGKSISCGILIAYFGTGTFIIKNNKQIIKVISISHSEYILINLYNANTENEQIHVLSSLFELLTKCDISLTKQLVVAGDFNLFFNSKLEAQGGNPTQKKNSLAELIEFKGTYDLCDIWRVRNTKSKWFTFTQKHSSGFIQHRLDYILISKTLQEL